MLFISLADACQRDQLALSFMLLRKSFWVCSCSDTLFSQFETGWHGKSLSPGQYSYCASAISALKSSRSLTRIFSQSRTEKAEQMSGRQSALVYLSMVSMLSAILKQTSSFLPSSSASGLQSSRSSTSPDPATAPQLRLHMTTTYVLLRVSLISKPGRCY